MALTQILGQTAGQITVLVPFVLHLVHEDLHATQVPAGAVFRVGNKTEHAAIQHDSAKLGDAVVVLIESDVGVLHDFYGS
ncbi:MAG: beta-class phenol-soluble modulin [Betaproteobacteria bacterium]|nr:beta-class phenol-soluble modulin [Betaproteobacteria bacterium]